MVAIYNFGSVFRNFFAPVVFISSSIKIQKSIKIEYLNWPNILQITKNQPRNKIAITFSIAVVTMSGEVQFLAPQRRLRYQSFYIL